MLCSLKFVLSVPAAHVTIILKGSRLEHNASLAIKGPLPL
jgi:hypothetical protein